MNVEIWMLGSMALVGALLTGAVLNGRFGKSSAVLDWRHFLFFVNRVRRPPKSYGPLLRVIRRLVPASWRYNPRSGNVGAFRKLLRRMGVSVLSAPFRRLIQGACFGLFLVLFFYVCWPYTARPAEPGPRSEGWAFAGFGQAPDVIELHFEGGSAIDSLNAGASVYLCIPGSDDAVGTQLAEGNLRSQTPGDGRVTFITADELSPEDIDSLMTAPTGWSFHFQPPNSWPAHYADDLARKETIPADLFLVLDPLVALSTAMASKNWVWSLGCAAAILLVCIVIPRGFCGYLCPLGTLIDLFDWSVGRRVKRFRVAADGWWTHLKYFVLLAVLIAAAAGVLLSGVVSAIPVITRGLLFIGDPVQTGVMRGWHQIPPMNAGQWLSIALFVAVLSLGFLRPRFWCKYVCPSGAVFSLGNLFRVSERKVETSCIHCNKCVDVCPFDAIKPDFTTRVTDCTLCQTCGGVCPTHAIKFVERWNVVDLKPANQPVPGEPRFGRRGFLSWSLGAAASVAAGFGLARTVKTMGADLGSEGAFLPVRPPGSVPEPDFLQMCIRCGECFKACPNHVLQPLGFEQGLEGLWTPAVQADWAGCESSCNACGQVCPTGAIRALPLAEKKVARMGLAIVNQDTCLPFANVEACQLCVDECIAAGYDAIEFVTVHTQVDAAGLPVPGSGQRAPAVRSDLCVGCGLCQTRCHGINVRDKGLLTASAIVIEAGEDREDRLLSGSYIELSRGKQAEQSLPAGDAAASYLPDQSP